MTATLLPGVRWCAARDADPRGLALFKRHYTFGRNKRGRKPWSRQFAGTGQRMVLLTPQADALFIWRIERYRKDGQTGVNCAVFRNESGWRSSDLIVEAAALAWVRWPGARLWTYVNARKLPPNKRPGYCFEMADWVRCGVSKGGLLIFERVAS